MGTRFKNKYTLETPYGPRSFELYEGDLFRFPEQTDILIVSSFIGDYYPMQGTMLYYLKEVGGISLNELSKNPLFNLREEKNVWISQKLTNKFVKYVICVEMIGIEWWRMTEDERLAQVSSRMDNLFLAIQILKTYDSSLKTAVMPILGSGNQRIPAEWVFNPLFKHGKNFYNQKNALEHIYIVERDIQKVEDASRKMDEVLGRKLSKLTSIFLDEQSAELLQEIGKQLGYLMDTCVELRHNSIVSSLHQKIDQRSVTYHDISENARSLLEYWIGHMSAAGEGNLKYKLINLDRSRQLPEWTLFYLHVIRTLGNSEVHISGGITPPVYPMEITLEDQRILLAVFLRFLKFWNQHAKAFRG